MSATQSTTVIIARVIATVAHIIRTIESGAASVSVGGVTVGTVRRNDSGRWAIDGDITTRVFTTRKAAAARLVADRTPAPIAPVTAPAVAVAAAVETAPIAPVTPAPAQTAPVVQPAPVRPSTGHLDATTAPAIIATVETDAERGLRAAFRSTTPVPYTVVARLNAAAMADRHARVMAYPVWNTDSDGLHTSPRADAAMARRDAARAVFDSLVGSATEALWDSARDEMVAATAGYDAALAELWDTDPTPAVHPAPAFNPAPSYPTPVFDAPRVAIPTSRTTLLPSPIHPRHTATVMTEARGWIADCGVTMWGASDHAIVRWVARQYDGGFGAFLGDAWAPDFTPVPAYTPPAVEAVEQARTDHANVERALVAAVDARDWDLAATVDAERIRAFDRVMDAEVAYSRATVDAECAPCGGPCVTP